MTIPHDLFAEVDTEAATRVQDRPHSRSLNLATALASDLTLVIPRLADPRSHRDGKGRPGFALL